jgi:hypothetical protein
MHGEWLYRSRFLGSGFRWIRVFNSRFRSLYPWGRLPNGWETGWTAEPVWTLEKRKFLTLPGGYADFLDRNDLRKVNCVTNVRLEFGFPTSVWQLIRNYGICLSAERTMIHCSQGGRSMLFKAAAFTRNRSSEQTSLLVYSHLKAPSMFTLWSLYVIAGLDFILNFS